MRAGGNILLLFLLRRHGYWTTFRSSALPHGSAFALRVATDSYVGSAASVRYRARFPLVDEAGIDFEMAFCETVTFFGA